MVQQQNARDQRHHRKSAGGLQHARDSKAVFTRFRVVVKAQEQQVTHEKPSFSTGRFLQRTAKVLGWIFDAE